MNYQHVCTILYVLHTKLPASSSIVRYKIVGASPLYDINLDWHCGTPSIPSVVSRSGEDRRQPAMSRESC